MCSVDVFFFQAEDGIRDLVRSRGLGDVYKRQVFKNRSIRIGQVRRRFPKRFADKSIEAEVLEQALSLIHI